jgi:DNA-binding transcriptional ArsR family regulator
VKPGTPRILRGINDRAALDLLLEHGPLSRSQLGELTGLSKPTTRQLLARLEDAGLVITRDRVPSSTPSTPTPPT